MQSVEPTSRNLNISNISLYEKVARTEVTDCELEMRNIIMFLRIRFFVDGSIN